MTAAPKKPLVAIACGGTGGHLFPGVAVGEELVRRGCEVLLLISPKEVDQRAVTTAVGMEFATLPAVGLTRGQVFEFLFGGWKSFRAARQLFRNRPPQAVLAMGGFTSAPPVLAGRMAGACTFLHESNAIPGRANRWLAHVVDQAFVGFPQAVARLNQRNTVITGTPVRPQFEPADPAACRMALGLDPRRPVLLITGGSQGASGINDLVIQALPELAAEMADLQILHLTGVNDAARMQAAYATTSLRTVVKPFLTEMELALGAATLTVSRAGGSSFAELAAMRQPAILIPYPAAADNHQLANARTFAEAGAARLLEQRGATGADLARLVLDLLRDETQRASLCDKLGDWHAPRAAEEIAGKMIELMTAMGHGPAGSRSGVAGKTSAPAASSPDCQRAVAV